MFYEKIYHTKGDVHKIKIKNFIYKFQIYCVKANSTTLLILSSLKRMMLFARRNLSEERSIY